MTAFVKPVQVQADKILPKREELDMNSHPSAHFVFDGLKKQNLGWADRGEHGKSWGWIGSQLHDRNHSVQDAESDYEFEDRLA